MTDQKQPKKIFGRGRGKPNNRQEGPWARSKKLDESHDIRPPRKDGDEFVLSDNCFPPLPGAAATDSGQFDDNVEAGTSQINGGVISDGKNPESKLGENTSNKYPTEPDEESKEKGLNEEKKLIEQDTNDTDVIAHDLRPTDLNKDKEHSPQNANTPVKTENKVYNHQIAEPKKRRIKRQESEHDMMLRLIDQHSDKPPEIIHTSQGETLLLKPSGRKFYINEDGSLGRRKYMLDDIRRVYLYTQQHLAKLLKEREEKKKALIKALDERIALEAKENGHLSEESIELEATENGHLSEERTELEATENGHLSEESIELETTENGHLSEERTELEATENGHLSEERTELEATENGHLSEERTELEATENGHLSEERTELEATENGHLSEESIELEATENGHLSKKCLTLETTGSVPVFKEVDIANSNLSPFAEEFVPRGLNMNPQALDFVPTFGSYDEANNNPVARHSGLPPMNVIDTAGMLADLEETVAFCYSKLIETPASYDELIGVVTPHYIKYMENPEVPNEIVQALYSYAIQDTRFAYFAIKILIHLIKMTCTEGNSPLRDKLLTHMQEEVQSTQNLRLTNPNVSCANEIQPFLTFLSELYIQLELGGRRLSLIGSALVETLRKLLTTGHIPIKERLKLIVNMIKLTGLSLDQDDPTILESLIRELGVLLVQERSNLDNPTFHFVNDIILLRNLRWGHVEPELSEYVENDSDIETSPNGNIAFANSNAYDPAYESNMVYSTGVFYGPDGHPIDSEEHLFLEVETNALNNLQIGDQGEPSPTSVEGFDEAYEEFLKTIPGHSPDSRC